MASQASLCNQKACLTLQLRQFSSQIKNYTSLSAFWQASCICVSHSFVQIAQCRGVPRPRHRHAVYINQHRAPDAADDGCCNSPYHDGCWSSPYLVSTRKQEETLLQESFLKERSGNIQVTLDNLAHKEEHLHIKLEELGNNKFANGYGMGKGYITKMGRLTSMDHNNKFANGYDMDKGYVTKMGRLTSMDLSTTEIASIERSRRQTCDDDQARMRLCHIDFLKQSWMCHHGSTFILIISSNVMDGPFMDNICQDLSLLHGLGIRLVIIPGTHIQIDRLLCEKGYKPHYVGSYRVTDDAALEASMEVAGKFQLGIEAKLSSQPSIPVLRRHGDNDRWHVGVGVASGNFIAAKRRGVVDGVDFGATGEVKRLDVARIKKRLDDNCIVILSNLGYSSSGEVLNCNTYEVATACARELQADKLISLLDGPLLDEDGRLIRFMTLQGADELIRKWAEQSETAANYVQAVAGTQYAKSLGLTKSSSFKTDHGNSGTNGSATSNGGVVSDENQNGARGHGLAIGGQERLSRDYGYLCELTAAVFVCRGGVQRVHLLDATIEGVLLLELYTRDGVGTMVASDRYEGTRAAEVGDLPKIEELLRPLEESGVLIKRSREQLLKEIGSFIVVERDASIIACAALFPYYEEKCAEVAALAVSSECRGNGQGDKLLDYMENKALGMGFRNLFLLTTRTADWFVRRGFSQCTIDCVPKQRQAKIDLTRGAKYYVKNLMSRSEN